MLVCSMVRTGGPTRIIHFGRNHRTNPSMESGGCQKWQEGGIAIALAQAMSTASGVRDHPPAEALVGDFADSTIDHACRFWHALDVPDGVAHPRRGNARREAGLRRERLRDRVPLSACSGTRTTATDPAGRRRRVSSAANRPRRGRSAPAGALQIRRRRRPGLTAAATTAVLATGAGPGVTAAATTAVFATGARTTPLLPTRDRLSGMSISFCLGFCVSLDRGDDRLDGNPPIGDQLAT